MSESNASKPNELPIVESNHKDSSRKKKEPLLKRVSRYFFPVTEMENKLQNAANEIENSITELGKIEEAFNLDMKSSRFIKVDTAELEKEIKQIKKIVGDYKDVLGKFRTSSRAITEHFQIASRNSLIISAFITIFAAFTPLGINWYFSSKKQNSAKPGTVSTNNQEKTKKGDNVYDFSLSELQELLGEAKNEGDEEMVKLLNNQITKLKNNPISLEPELENILDEIIKQNLNKSSLSKLKLKFNSLLIKVNEDGFTKDKVLENKVILIKGIFKLKEEKYDEADSFFKFVTEEELSEITDDAHYYRGYLFQKKNEPNKTLKEYKKAIDVSQDLKIKYLENEPSNKINLLNTKIKELEDKMMLITSSILIFNAASKNGLAEDYKERFEKAGFMKDNIEAKTWQFKDWASTIVFFFDEDDRNDARKIATEMGIFKNQETIQNVITSESNTIKKIKDKRFVVVLARDLIYQ